MDKNNENLMNTLIDCGAITPLQRRLMDALAFCTDADSELFDLLALLLCRQNFGDTRIPLDSSKLEARLLKTLENFGIPCEPCYKESLQKAARKISDGSYEGIVGTDAHEHSFFKKPFTLKDNYLYPTKYFYSKLTVEQKVCELFVAQTPVKGAAEKCIENVASFTKDARCGSKQSRPKRLYAASTKT